MTPADSTRRMGQIFRYVITPRGTQRHVCTHPLAAQLLRAADSF